MTPLVPFLVNNSSAPGAENLNGFYLTRNSLPLLLVTLFQNVVVDPPLMITFDPLPLVTEP